MNKVLLTVQKLLCCVAGLLTSASFAAGQTPKNIAPFEVASIRPHDPKLRPATMKFLPSGEVEIAGMTLKNVVLLAYGLRDYQISGGPKWMDSELYDIRAKGKPPMPRHLMEEQYARLRVLLADRFALKTHQEERTSSVYYLNAAKGGPKLPRAGENAKPIRGSILPWSLIVNEIGRRVDRPLVDNLHLEGSYVIALRYTTDEGVPSGIGVGRIDPNDAAAQSDPSIFAALQEQLGLRLDPGKGKVELLVIDSATPPSAN